MKAVFRFGLVVVGGLVLGLGGRHYFETKQDRVSAAIGLFERVCVPVSLQGDIEAAPDLSDLVPVGLRHSWADPTSQFILTLDENRCSISDILLYLNAQEQVRFDMLVGELVASAFPMLEADDVDGAPEGGKFQLWSQSGQDGGQKWGVLLTRWPEQDTDLDGDFDQAHTVLSVSFEVK
ncbi:MAG: hypothetical protein ABJ370_00025 [Paracoccaceae bacterium]